MRRPCAEGEGGRAGPAGERGGGRRRGVRRGTELPAQLRQQQLLLPLFHRAPMTNYLFPSHRREEAGAVGFAARPLRSADPAAREK